MNLFLNIDKSNCNRILQVRKEKDVLKSMKLVKEKFGGVNVLINSAGVLGVERTYDFKTKKPHSVDLFKCIHETNVFGVFNVTRLMVGMMAENTPDKNQQRGVIINLASMLAYEAGAGLIAYGSSKSAVAGMTMTLARDFAQKGIRVVGICPGYIDTPMTCRLYPLFQSRLPHILIINYNLTFSYAGVGRTKTVDQYDANAKTLRNRRRSGSPDSSVHRESLNKR